MEIAIRYYSETGNTEKLANVISDVTKVPALPVSNGLLKDVDILFLGSSVYYSAPKKEVVDFIKNINVNVGTVINFSTATIMKSTYNGVKRKLDSKHIKISRREFHCKGSWAAFFESRPNEKDLKNCRQFTKYVLEEYEQKQKENN